jgi:hypothetical protein
MDNISNTELHQAKLHDHIVQQIVKLTKRNAATEDFLCFGICKNTEICKAQIFQYSLLPWKLDQW